MHERGGLLERLQHPVARLVAQLIDALDHEHPTRRLERGPARRRDDGAVDVADEDLVRTAGRDPREIRVRAGRDPVASTLRVGRALAQQLRGDLAGDLTLAGAAGTVEQVGVRWPPARRERRSQQSAGVGLSVELGRHAFRS